MSSKRKDELRHDTPLDAVPAGDAGARALTRIQQLETLEALYAAWAELKRDRQRLRAQFASEHRHLDEQGALVLGAVRTAHSVTELAPPEAGLELFLNDSRAKLEAIRRELLAREAHELAAVDEATRRLSAALRARIERQGSAIKPVVRVMVRPMPAGHRILHAERLSPDAAVILFFALTGKIPSRYEYLFDDSTDDVNSVPAWVYADEGLTLTRPSPSELQTALEALREVWPLKGMIPLWLPPDRQFARWLQRGPVMEAEVADGDRFRNLLTPDEAERFLGLLLSFKLTGHLDLELVTS